MTTTPREEFEQNKDRNVFIMMHYGEHGDYERIERIVRDTLSLYGFKGTLARDHTYFRNLWDSVEHCIEYSRYGIVVCEQNPIRHEFNPNVAVELGYMMALRKEVLILKENEMQLPTNLQGLFCKKFSRRTLKKDLEKAIISWLSDRRHIPAIERISGETSLQSKINRTQRIIEVLEEAEPGSIVRQAGIFSSLAITKREALAEDDSNQLRDLLLMEQRAMIAALERGITLRCMISPHVQKVAIELNPPEMVRSSALPRIEQLIRVIELKQSNLQIVYVAYLPYPNMLIVGDQLFIGRRRLHEWGFPSTTIVHDPEQIRDEITQFDILFGDAAQAILGKKDCNEKDYGSEPLKEKVVRHLRKCYRDLEEWSADD